MSLTEKILSPVYEMFWDYAEEDRRALAILFLALSIITAILVSPLWLFEYFVLGRKG